MSARPVTVLFVCTHNSARSIMAEALLNHLGSGRVQAFSAGSSPTENQQPHPLALRTLERHGISIEGLFSKNWLAFADLKSPRLDVVITVCDRAAGDACPVFPDHPALAHWGYEDPSSQEGSDEERDTAFETTFELLTERVKAFLELPLDQMDRTTLGAACRALATGS